MKLFPHILARVGGSTFAEVEALSFGKMDLVNVLVEKERELGIQFEKVLQSFQSTFQKTNDFRLRAILNNAKKDFQNHRFSFVKKLEKNNHDAFLKELLFEISNYLNWNIDLEKLKHEFEFNFRKEEIIQYLKLIDFFQDQNIQKGVLQSSHSLFNQIKKLDSDSFLDFRKKERQTLRALAQYFYRIGTKTSPFSHFTTLDILSEKGDAFQNEILDNDNSFFQFNNFILAEMKNLFLKESSFFRQLKLQVNPSLSLRNDEFYFIKNSRNVETIQQLEASEILKELTQTIIPDDGIKFELVVNQLLKLVEANQESIENYLLDLIELGFLEWNWGFSGLDFGWEEKFQKVIFSMGNIMNLTRWSVALGKILDVRIQLELSENTSPYLLQKSLKSDLEELGLKNIVPELIFFEDVKKSTSIQLQKNEIKPIIQSLDSLLRLLEPLMKNEIKNRIVNCWNQNFKDEKSIPLVYFYENFYKKTFDNAPAITIANKKREEFLKLGIKKNGRIDKEGNLYFYTKDLKNIFSERSKTTSSQYSGLFQFYKNNGKTKAVINGLTPGFGKLFGRFLPLLDGKITIQLQKWNSEIQDDNLWVENVDASIFNANLHPPLLNYEIKNSGSKNNLSSEKQISVKDIEVTWDDVLDEPVLVFSKTKKRISIFDFGFEHPENRSPMFQLLNGFSIPHATYRSFLNLVNQLFVDEKPNKIKGFRRVVIDEHLVLQRQFSEVPNSFFPKKEKSESNSSYFLKIQKWKVGNDIPQFIFIQPIPNTENSTSNSSRDFFKPQLIDLNSPIAIVLFQKVLEKHSGRIRIIEMLPNGEQLIGDSVAEFAVQWKLDEQLNE